MRLYVSLALIPLVTALFVPISASAQEPADCEVGTLDNTLGNPSLSSAIKLTSKGNHLGGQGDLDSAIACFKKAISAKPDYVPAHLGLALAYQWKGEYQRALDVLSSAPSESDLEGEAFDSTFEIAFQKVLVLLAKYQQTGFKGEMPDLLAALKEARKISRDADHRVTESQKRAARALGIDVDADRKEQISMIDNLLSDFSK